MNVFLAMLPLIREAVLAHGWIDETSLTNFIAVSESTPGPFAINMATYVGNQVGGIFGSFCATLGVVLPSFVIILIVAKCYDRFKESKIVKGIMTGLKPAVVGLIGAAIFSLFLPVFFPVGLSLSVFSASAFWVSLAIFALCLVLAFKKVHPILLISLCAALGILYSLIPGATIA